MKNDERLQGADGESRSKSGSVPFLVRFAQRRHGAPTPRGETTLTKADTETSDE